MESYGSCCIVWQPALTASMLLWPYAASFPSKNIRPESGRTDPSMIFAIVDLPDPDSPARTNVSPRPRENDTPSAALVTDAPDGRRPKSPFFAAKCFLRPSTLSISSTVRVAYRAI